MKSIRGTAYLTILQFMAAADIAAAVSFIPRIPCAVREYTTTNRVVAAIILTPNDILLMSKYVTIMAGCLERAIALSNPFRYSHHWMIVHMKKFLSFLWLVIAVITVIRDVVFFRGICIEGPFGPVNAQLPEPSALTIIPMHASAVVTIVALVKVFCELCKMKRRINVSQQEKDIANAAKVMSIITVTFLLFLLSTIVNVLVMKTFKLEYNYSMVAFTNFNAAGLALYGIVNTIIYGFLTEGYRNAVRRCFKMVFCNQNHVSQQQP